MTSLFCGLLDLGGSPDPDAVLSAMCDSMAPEAGFQVAVRRSGPLSLAAFSTPNGPEIHEAGGDLLAGSFEAAFPYDRTADASSIAPPELSALFTSDPGRALGRLDGEFATVHWNATAGRLTLGRDHFGTRTLYYISAPGRWLAFASLPSALLVPSLCDGRLNHAVVARLALNNAGRDEQTEFEAIRRVIPGTYLEVTQTTTRTVRYWELAQGDPISPDEDANEVFAELRSLLLDAVRLRLPRSGPVVGHLSGGLDSSSVGLAALQSMPDGTSFRGYGFHPPAPPPYTSAEDETTFLAAITAAEPRIDLVKIPVEGLGVLGDGHVDPISGALSAPTDGYPQIADDAYRHGADRILCGWGGDEAISYHGRDALAEILLSGRLGNAIRFARLVSARTGTPAWRLLASQIRANILPSWLSGLPPRTLSAPGGLRDRLSKVVRPHLRESAVSGEPESRPDMTWMRIQRLTWGHVWAMQERVAYRSAQWGLCYCSPLLDRALVEFVLRLPAEFSIWEGRRRAPLREATVGLLPDTVRLNLGKRSWDPTERLRLIGAREKMLTQVARLRTTEADAIFELDVIEHQIREMPSEDDFMVALEKSAGRPGAANFRGFDFIIPLQLAIFAGAPTRRAGRYVSSAPAG